MTRCPCGCHCLVKPGKKYAKPGCGGRMYWRSLTLEQIRNLTRQREAKMSPAEKRARIERLVGAGRVNRWEMLVERWMQVWEEGGDPRQALIDAYRHGYAAGMSRSRRREAKEKAA